MIDQLSYNEQHKKMIAVLIEMKKSIDRYRSKEHHNPEWLKKQERWLIEIGQYVRENQNILENLMEENRHAFNQGFAKAQQLGKQPSRKDYFNPFDIHPEVVKKFRAKEGIRLYHNKIQKTKWNDHY